MDTVWRTAPAAALCVWLGPAGVVTQANAVAAAWASGHGVGDEEWQALASAQLAQSASGVVAEGATAEASVGGVAVRVARVPLLDGRLLLWLTFAEDDDRAAVVRRATGFLDRALNLAGISVWRIDLRTQRVHFNGTGFALQGLQQDPAGLSLAQVRESIHPDDREAVLRAADEAMRSARVVDVEARYRRGRDAWQTLLTRRVADRDDNGVVTGLAGISIDLSAQAAERQRADTLAASSRLVAEAIGVGFWTRDLDAGTAHWDEQMYRIHRRPPEAGPPGYEQWIELYVHPLDRAWVMEMHHAASAGWEPTIDATFRAPAPDGSERWIRTWTRRLVRDGHRLAFGMHLDVTDRHQAQVLMQRERARAQFATEAAGVGVWERSLDGHISYWNAEMYRLRGLQPADPRPLDELGAACPHPDDLPLLSAMVERHLREGTPYRMEFRVRLADGSWRWLVTQGSAMTNAEGHFMGMAGINLDITERKQADALKLQKEGAERASRDKSAFLARVSHELRTPMNAVLGFAHLLEDDSADPPTLRQRERLRRISEAGTQMMALVDDLLELAHLDSGAPASAGELLNLADVARQVLEPLAPLAAQRGVALRTLLPPAAVLVRAERRRLVQVLTHLLGHAVRQQRSGGRVELACQLDDGAAGATICVRDDGRGYDADELATLFEPFLRPGASARSGEDTGIGLSLAQRVATAMGSRIEVSSQRGDGTEYRLRLPAETAPQPPAPPAPAALLPLTPSAAGARPLKVLCVEDNPVNLLLVRELLSLRPDVQLFEAVDGCSGLACALAERPDVLLLDLQLPDIGGLEVLARLRADPGMAGCVYVALSANAMPDHIDAARRAGFDDYWTKPIDFERFLGGIDQLAEQVQGARRSRSQAVPSSR